MGTEKEVRDGPPGALRRAWRWLRAPSAKYPLLTLLAIGFAGGIIFWGGFNTALEATNTEKFCISCHEMRDFVYEEYTHTIHYSNRTGVRATCSDCHVPKEWHHKMVRKVVATGELWGKLTGSINTREKFEAKRLHLARKEWNRMRANDSRACRNCHDFVSMDAAAQSKPAARRHAAAMEKGDTCIKCHKGIAHQLPEGMTAEDES